LARPLTGGPRITWTRRFAIRLATRPTVNPSLTALGSPLPRSPARSFSAAGSGFYAARWS
jgi:hypothetical protein